MPIASHLTLLQSSLFFNGGDYLQSDGALGLRLDHKHYLLLHLHVEMHWNIKVNFSSTVCLTSS